MEKHLEYMEDISEHQDIPEKFDDFLVVFRIWVDWQKSLLSRFLGKKYQYDIIIEDYQSFAFLPVEKKVIIPLKWLQNFHRNLTTEKHQNANAFLYTFADLKFGLFHELSHFRDMINEKDRKKRGAMISVLTYINDQSIDAGEGKHIPIGHALHSVVNGIDDIIVNREVEVYTGSRIDREHLKGFYVYHLFANLIEKEWGDYITSEEHVLEYVWTGKGTHIINDDGDVDYSKGALSNGFSNYLLRSFMVPSQKILLDPKVESVLFNNSERKSKISYKRAFKNLVQTMKDYLEEVSKAAGDDAEKKKRIENFQAEYQNHIVLLEGLCDNTSIPQYLNYCLRVTTHKAGQYVWETLPLFDIIEMFQYSSGKWNSHTLDISPWMRYELMKAIFLPIHKGFILMDLLTQDIKEGKRKPWKGKGKGKGKGEGEGEGKGEGKEEWEDKDSDASGSADVHESPDIAAKIKLLEDLEEEDNKQDEKELIKKTIEEAKFDVESVLASSGVDAEGRAALAHIATKYAPWVEEVVKFLLEELAVAEKLYLENEFYSRKWKLRVKKLIEYISDDPTLSEIDEQRFYNKKEFIEKVSERIKKIDLTLAIDISWSTATFRGKDGMINILSTVLFLAMKHLEQHIQTLIDEPNFAIPVHFILYGNGNPYSSRTGWYENAPEEVRMAELNSQILALSWGTNDTTAWTKINHEIGEYLQTNPDYVEEVKNARRKPIFVQIADSDVSENWVDILKGGLLPFFESQELIDRLPIKRIILWVSHIEEVTEEELKRRQKEGHIWNWEPIVLPNGKIQLKQVNLKSREEIVRQLKDLFKNFFDDINYI